MIRTDQYQAARHSRTARAMLARRADRAATAALRTIAQPSTRPTAADAAVAWNEAVSMASL